MDSEQTAPAVPAPTDERQMESTDPQPNVDESPAQTAAAGATLPSTPTAPPAAAASAHVAVNVGRDDSGGGLGAGETSLAGADFSIIAIHPPQKKVRTPVPAKVIVQFQAAGGAPQLKTVKFKITASEKFHAVTQFLRKQLKMGENESLFLYINQAFQPAPDELVSNLYQCFEVGGKLNMDYCLTPAWG